jgi:drug/metabolite transporter (DMT)-like permease
MSPELAAHGKLRVILAFAAIYVIWGSTYLGIVFALESFPPFVMAALRMLLAGGALYLWARSQGEPNPRRSHWKWAFLLGGLFFLIGNGTVVWVEQEMSSGIVALIVAMVSVWTALLEWLRPGGARPSNGVIAGIVLGFLGVAILVMPADGVETEVRLVPALMLVGSTLGWALASVLSRTAEMPKSTAMTSAIEMLGGGLLLTVAAFATGEWARFDLFAVTPKAGGAFLYLVLFGSLLAFSCFAWLLKVTTPNKVATSGYVNPMVAVFLGWAFAGEVLTGRTIVASLVIVASVVLIVTGKELAPKARRTAELATE